MIEVPLSVRILAAEEALWHPLRPTKHIDREGEVDWVKLDETMMEKVKAETAVDLETRVSRSVLKRVRGFVEVRAMGYQPTVLDGLHVVEVQDGASKSHSQRRRGGAHGSSLCWSVEYRCGCGASGCPCRSQGGARELVVYADTRAGAARRAVAGGFDPGKFGKVEPTEPGSKGKYVADLAPARETRA